MESNISTQGLLFQGVMVFNATFNNISVISSVVSVTYNYENTSQHAALVQDRYHQHLIQMYAFIMIYLKRIAHILLNNHLLN